MENSEIKIQHSIVAELTLTMPSGENFIVSYLTVEFAATRSDSVDRGIELTQQLKAGIKNIHTNFINGVIDNIKATIGQGCKVEHSIVAFPTRIQKPVKSGWGRH